MATFVSPVTVSPMRNVLTLRSQNLNTVLTHVKGSVTIVVEDELESHEVLAGARRIGRAIQPRSDRSLHSATAGGKVPLNKTMMRRQIGKRSVGKACGCTWRSRLLPYP